MAELRENRYGKTGIRMIKVVRDGSVHHLSEWTVRVLLQGDLADVHLKGDNSKVLATDTMKNIVYARANVSQAGSMEEFADELLAFLLERNPQIGSGEVHIESALWKRLTIDGEPHPHSFMKGSAELATVTLHKSRDGSNLRCGIEEMVVLKTAQSAFTGFIRDEYTTLKESTDRLFGTAISASWNYEDTPAHGAFNGLRGRVRESLLRVFATHDSLSVQQTLFAMAEKTLADVAELAEMTITMPNRHNIPVDMAPFGMENRNSIFVPTVDPSGYIEARVTRA